MVEFAPNSDPEAKRRRSTRIVQAVPLTVTGVDALGRPFQERTSTLIVNCHGCRYQSKHYVLKNMWVTLEIPHPETGRPPRSVRARVMWIQRPRTVRELFQIGVELEVPGNVWGIAFPPEDWFPYPETAAPEIPLPAMEAQAAVEGWVAPSAAADESNVRVLPMPGSADASLTLARQVAQLVAEAKQQVQNAAREATVKAVSAETRPLLAAIHDHFTEAAEKAMQAAAGSYTDQVIRQAMAKIDDARQAASNTLREEWAREVKLRVEEAGQQLVTHLTEIGETRRAAFDQQLETHLNQALADLKKLSGELQASVEDAGASVQRFRKEIDASVGAASQGWQQTVGGKAVEATAHLEELEKATQQLNSEINAAVTTAQADWRGRLDADLGAAAARWNEKIEASLEDAAREATGRLARDSRTTASQLKQELNQRMAALRQSFEQATSEAERTLDELRKALEEETGRAKASLAETQQVADRMEEYASRLDTLSQATSEELQRRFEAILATESTELNQRAESAVAGMANRLQPVLEAAGQQTVARLATQLEQQLTAHLDRASELVQKLAASQGLAEETLRVHREHLLAASDQSVQEGIARLQETLIRLEKDFREAGRAAITKWLAELEEKSTDTTHTTFEALYKTSEWYEKKIQTHMQGALDKGLEQASNGLREKAGEISGLFASELDHYSRTYVEHAQGQMDEAVKDAVERARGQLAQAGETTAATFGDQIHQAAQGEFRRFTGSVSSTLEQTTAQLEAHTTQLQSKTDAEARRFFVEFHKGMTQEIQQGVAQARQELETQVAPVKEAWRAEREAQQRQLQDALARFSDESLDTFKARLQNVSNSWMVTTVATLSQQSQSTIEALASSAEQQLRETCSQVFASVGETLRERLLDLSRKVPNSIPSPEKK